MKSTVEEHYGVCNIVVSRYMHAQSILFINLFPLKQTVIVTTLVLNLDGTWIGAKEALDPGHIAGLPGFDSHTSEQKALLQYLQIYLIRHPYETR